MTIHTTTLVYGVKVIDKLAFLEYCSGYQRPEDDAGDWEIERKYDYKDEKLRINLHDLRKYTLNSNKRCELMMYFVTHDLDEDENYVVGVEIATNTIDSRYNDDYRQKPLDVSNTKGIVDFDRMKLLDFELDSLKNTEVIKLLGTEKNLYIIQDDCGCCS